MDVPDSWQELSDALARHPGVVLFLGEPDAGKSTCALYLVEELRSRGLSVALVDGDIGQAHLGPPATQGFALATSQGLQLQNLYFVGAITPAGFLMQVAGGLKKLADHARARKVQVILVNTTGFVSGSTATALKLHKVELLSPRHIVAIERGDELGGILRGLSSSPELSLHRLAGVALLGRGMQMNVRGQPQVQPGTAGQQPAGQVERDALYIDAQELA